MITIGYIWQNTVGKDELIKELIDLPIIERNREKIEIMGLAEFEYATESHFQLERYKIWKICGYQGPIKTA